MFRKWPKIFVELSSDPFELLYIFVFCRYQLTYSDLAELVVAQLPREEDIKIAAQCKEDILVSSLARSVTLTWPMFSVDLKKSQPLVYILKMTAIFLIFFLFTAF